MSHKFVGLIETQGSEDQEGNQHLKPKIRSWAANQRSEPEPSIRTQTLS